MKNKIFIYDLERTLLIFLLIIDIKKDKVVYVSYKKNEKILNKLLGEKILVDENKLDVSIVKRIKYIKNFRNKYQNLIKKIKNEEYILYGLDQYPIANRIFYDAKINVIEEGTINYLEYNSKNYKEKIKKLFLKIFLLEERNEVLGYGNKVEKIYLTENMCKEIPQGLEKKAEIINLKELWNKKSEEEKKIILNTFNFNEEILKKADKNTIMLFTQPLSEDNVITEEEKIDLYSKILKKYDNQSIIIKPHPREKTDYSKYFPSYYVMKERYPVEILELVGINIKKAITIFSSAAFGLGKNVEIDFYGTEIYYKLFERFGTQDKVMKRNAFLD